MSGEKCEVWFKAKHSHLVMPTRDFLKQVAAHREGFDPKLAFEKLQAKEKAGEVRVATQEPSSEGQPITLTVTSKDASDKREAYEVDPKTKLVQRVIEFAASRRQMGTGVSAEYLDYNKEIDPKIFQLDLPAFVITLDQINQVVGLPKGDLSEKEIVLKLVRDWTAAMVAKDYAKAGKLFRPV